jgi:Mg2+/citrate symporter
MAFFGPLFVLILVLVAVWLGLSLWLRLAERRRLTQRWEAEGRPGERDGFVRTGMAAYERSLRRRLLWLVVVLPLAALAAVLYLLNIA